MFLNYTGLPDAVFGELSRHFGCSWSASEIEAMNLAASRDAKIPASSFQPDTEAKRREAGEHLIEICRRKLEAVYQQLEEVRRRRS